MKKVTFESSCGTSEERSIASRQVRQPFLENPTVITRRKKGRRLLWSGSPARRVSNSGQSSATILP